ncbi:MAG: fumarate reductase subunit C [Dehalococcoidia bacterium]|nr:fumarate reductase subunit C [Dehalococcoidia bacterium]
MTKPYPRQHTRSWFLAKWSYRIFMLRELSAVFIALYVVLLLGLVRAVRDGEVAFGDYLELLQSPLLIAFHVLTLAFAVLHSVTWFQAVPQAIRVRRGEELVPAGVLVGAHVVAWAGVSVVVALLFLV